MKDDYKYDSKVGKLLVNYKNIKYSFVAYIEAFKQAPRDTLNATNNHSYKSTTQLSALFLFRLVSYNMSRVRCPVVPPRNCSLPVAQVFATNLTYTHTHNEICALKLLTWHVKLTLYAVEL